MGLYGSSVLARQRSVQLVLRALIAVLLVPVVVLSAASVANAAASTYVVTSTGDSSDTNVGDGNCIAFGGGCTLRAAIEEANDDNDHDIVEFALGGPATIVAASSLPIITESLTIDGSTNPGANCDYLGGAATSPIPTVAISGTGLGFYVDVDEAVVRNLSVHSGESGVSFGSLASLSVLECSWIGFDLNGLPGTGQTGFGVLRGTRIGGNVGESGNVIGAFGQVGVNTFGDVLGNRIGVRPDGSPAGTGAAGVVSSGDVRFNLIAHSGTAGVVPTAGAFVASNTIRNNAGAGIQVNTQLPPPPGTSYDPSRTFRWNNVFQNGQLGIDQNQSGDAYGPSSDDITVTSIAGTALSVRLRVGAGQVGDPHEVDVFFNNACDPSGFGEGEDYRETFAVVPTATETFHTFNMVSALGAAQFISATLTDNLNTSEFSNCVDESPRFVVNSPANDGDVNPDGVCASAAGFCTLRAAMEEVNGLGGGIDEIVFDLNAGTLIPVSGSPLPFMTTPVTIDATSNAGAVCGTASAPPSGLIRIQTTSGLLYGLEFGTTSAGSVVRGLKVTGFAFDGVRSYGDNNVFQCNIFGAGATSGGNVGDGIEVQGDNTLVGGSTAFDGNLIGANGAAGVRIAGTASFIRVSSNWIGTDGLQSFANNVGVEIEGFASNNTVGSFGESSGGPLVPLGANVIGGNTNHGVNVLGTGTNNYVTGNRIGVGTGGAAIANGRHGVRVEAPDTLIGRGRGAFNLFFDDPNVIGNNSESGMALFGDDVLAVGNFVGVDPDGVADIGNKDHGIFLGGTDGLLRGNVIGNNDRDGIVLNGVSNNVEANLIGVEADGFTPAGNGERGVEVLSNANSVGGTNPADGNLIAYSGLAGVRMSGSAEGTTVRQNTIRDNDGDGIAVSGTATRNRFLENVIMSNGGFGVDLGADGTVNPNDTNDSDTGPNDLMNRIEITDVDATNTLIDFKFQGTPNLVHQVEFYANLVCAPNGAGQGRRPIPGLFGFTTDGNGDFNGVFDAQGGFAAGEVLTALTTGTSFGGVYTTTSEYADCFTAPGTNTTDSDSDTVHDIYELNADTDGDGVMNWLDDDDDGDGRPTAVENPDPNSDSDPSDALNSDGMGPVDYLDPAELFRMLDPACLVLQTGTVYGGDSIDFAVSGGAPLTPFGVGPDVCVVPDSATAVMANVIIVDPVAAGNLRLTAAGTAPLGGVVNFSSNELMNSNTVSVPLSPSGELNVSVNLGGSTAVAAGVIEVEILGFYEAAETPSLVFNAVTACAVFDSRTAQGGTGPITVDTSVAIDVVGSFPAAQGGGNTNCQVPSGVEGVLANVVAVNPSGPTEISAVASGAMLVANQTNTPPMNNSSAVTIPVDGSGKIALAVDVAGSTNLRVVVLGYYFPTMVGAAAAAGLEFHPLVPCAAFDSRSGLGATGGFLGQRTNGQVTTYDVVGAFPPTQGGGNSDCGVPASAEAVELNLVAVMSSAAGNLQVAEAGIIPTGGVVNFSLLAEPMNNSNAVAVRVNAGGQLAVTINGGNAAPGLAITDIRGVISGYYTFQADD